MFKLFGIFLRIGAFTIGGGYAMIPLVQEELVENQKLLSEEDFLDVLAVSQSFPGALAVNSSTMIGYRLYGVPGALLSALGVILPSFTIILLLAGVILNVKDHPLYIKGMAGVKPVVAALIFVSVYKLQKAIDKSAFTIGVFALGLLIMILLDLSPIVAILSAVAAGILKGVRG